MTATTTTHTAIADSILRAVHGLDTNDATLFKSAWIDNPSTTFTMTPGTTHTGFDAIHTNIFLPIGPLSTLHSISNIRVDHKEGSDQAKVTTYAMANHFRPEEGLDPGKGGLLSGSMYDIDCVFDKTDGLWKMSRWDMKIVYLQGDMTILTG